KELADDVRRSVKARFILDQFAEQTDLGVEQEEVGQYLAQIAYQQGVQPDQLARQLGSSGQLAAGISDVLRSKAADLLAESVKVTDASGRKVVIAGPDAEDESGDGAGDQAGESMTAEEQPEEPEEPEEPEKPAAAAAKEPSAKGRG